MSQNAFAAGAPLGELTALPSPLAGFWGKIEKWDGKGSEGDWERETNRS